MSASTLTDAPKFKFAASAVLKYAAAFWLAAALIGQWAFFYYISVFYGPSTLTGHFESWRRNTLLFKGYVPGDTAGNIAFGTHALLAAIIAFGGALQLVPQIRNYAPVFHRWNGRVFMATASSLSLVGFYLVWVRHSNQGILGAISSSFNGVLILTFAVLAWRTARARKFTAHGRWAMRLYLVSNAQWFLRVGVFSWIALQGNAGLHPFYVFWGWGCILLPLAVFELYWRIKMRGGPSPRLAMAGGLVALTLVMSVGTFGFFMLTQRIISGTVPATF